MSSNDSVKAAAEASKVINKIIGILSSLGWLIFFTFPDSKYEIYPFWSKFIYIIDKDPVYNLIYFIRFFITIHIIRFSFGLLFLSYDKSFGRAQKAVGESKKKEIIGLILRAVFIFALFCLTKQLTDSNYIKVCVNLGFQAFLLMAFNILYRKELYKKDSETKSNYFILVGDFIFLIATILLFIIFNTPLDYLISLSVVFLIGGYFVIFFGEFITQYFPSLILAFKDVGDLIKSLKKT